MRFGLRSKACTLRSNERAGFTPRTTTLEDSISRCCTIGSRPRPKGSLARLWDATSMRQGTSGTPLLEVGTTLTLRRDLKWRTSFAPMPFNATSRGGGEENDSPSAQLQPFDGYGPRPRLTAKVDGTVALPSTPSV